MIDKTDTTETLGCDEYCNDDPIVIPMDHTAWFTPLALIGCFTAAVILALAMS